MKCNFKVQVETCDGFNEQHKPDYVSISKCLLKSNEGCCDEDKCIFMVLFRPTYVIEK